MICVRTRAAPGGGAPRSRPVERHRHRSCRLLRVLANAGVPTAATPRRLRSPASERATAPTRPVGVVVSAAPARNEAVRAGGGTVRPPQAVVRGLEILEEDSPRHAVDCEMVDREEESAGARAAIEVDGASSGPRWRSSCAWRGRGRLDARAWSSGGTDRDRHDDRRSGRATSCCVQAALPAKRSRRASWCGRPRGAPAAARRRRCPAGPRTRTPGSSGRVHEVLLEEPVLNWRQRDCARGDPAVACGIGTRLPDAPERARRSWGLEEVSRRDVQAGLAALGDHLDAEDRVAAQLEEVVVDADLLDAEHLAPDARNASPRSACAARRMACSARRG